MRASDLRIAQKRALWLVPDHKMADTDMPRNVEIGFGEFRSGLKLCRNGLPEDQGRDQNASYR
jgi:hypothetical protein